jgi:hypothetical protein
MVRRGAPKSDIAEPAQAALALVEKSIARLAAACVELSRSNAWNDLLGTLDRLAALLGADVGPAAEPVPGEVDPAEVGRFVAGWVQSLLLPEYLEHSAPGRLHYRVRLPEEARADGLGDLVDFLESLRLRLDLSVDGDTVRLAISVGGGDRPALAAVCGADSLDLDLDLGATRGALRHMGALVERVPAARRAARRLELEELSGTLRFSFASSEAGHMRLACALGEPLRIIGRNDEGPLQIEVGASELLAIDGDAAGALNARVEMGAVQARMPASMVEAGESGAAEYRLARAGGELHATRGDRALKLRRLTLGGQPAVARRDGKVVASMELVSPSAGFDLQPAEPGRFVIAPEGDLSLRLEAAGQEVTVSVPAGARLEMLPGRLRVEKGRLVLGGPGATTPVEVGEGRALVRRKEPRSGERHPLLRFYESVAIR